MALPFLANRHGKELSEQPIWIDAVCINQAEDDEKFFQINLVNQIYKRARKVWVWLGLAPDQSYIAQVVSLLPLMTTYNRAIKSVGVLARPELPEKLRGQEPAFWDASIIRALFVLSMQANRLWMDDRYFELFMGASGSSFEESSLAT